MTCFKLRERRKIGGFQIQARAFRGLNVLHSIIEGEQEMLGPVIELTKRELAAGKTHDWQDSATRGEKTAEKLIIGQSVCVLAEFIG